jgi:hypothetical protein
MSLDDLIKEAKLAGLNVNEINTMTKQYEFGIIKAYDVCPDPDFVRFRTALQAIHHHRITIQYCGEAFARKYIRETVERKKQS